MKDQLVEFETVELLRKVTLKTGSIYQLDCDTYFDMDTKEAGEVDNHYTDFSDLSKEGIKWFKRPTQSLLQKWLREVHNLTVIPAAYDLFQTDVDQGRTRKYYYFIHEIGNRICSLPSPFNSYEEALEAGLIQALNLLSEK